MTAHPSVPAGVVPVRLRFDGPKSFVESYMEDVELGGIYIATSVDVPLGTKVDLTVDFGGGKGLRCFSEVVKYVPAVGGQFRVGVRFTNLDPAYRRWIDATVAKSRATQSKEHLLRKATGARALADSNLSIDSLRIEGASDDIMGIDLGTCNSCACVFVDGRPVIVDLSADNGVGGLSGRSLPSVVSFEAEGGIAVGAAAKEKMASNARRTIFGAKRFIGRTYESPVVQNMLSRFPYKIVPGCEGKVSIDVNGHPMSLTAVSAKVLDAIKREVDQRIHRVINRAIITVPAYYNDNQRNAVIAAGRLAGLTVERVLNEPTAAAIAYGLTKSKPRRLIVYDLGGGTFDVSVMTVHKDSLQVLATAGDTFLGGEDFDAALMEYVIELFEKKNKKAKLSRNSAALAGLKLAVEKAKMRLSVKDKTMVTVRNVMLLDNTTTRMEVEVHRKEYERRVEPLMTRTLKICDMALREAGLEKSKLGDVILVGGQTRMPYVEERVRLHFNISPRCDINPDEVVALGAGMLAQLSKAEQGKLKDVLSMTIGVAAGASFRPLIPRNTALPTAKRIKVTVERAQWHKYKLDVWQGDSASLHQNEFLGSIRVDALSPGTVDPANVCIDFALTPDCLLKVRVVNLETEESKVVLLETRDH